MCVLCMFYIEVGVRKKNIRVGIFLKNNLLEYG